MPFSRLIQLIGDDAFTTLSQQTVMIVGLGGVGGSACEAIVRSGIQHIILVDGDVVRKSNLNRQIIALQSTIGQSKVKVMKSRIADINPDAVVEIYPIMYNFDTKQDILNHRIDFIIDAIDTITFKIDLIKEAFARDIPIISVMGTGNKFLPQKLDVMPLSKTAYDPIARILRQKLKQELNLNYVPVVASTEPPLKVDSLKMSPSSNAFVPNTAGILAASHVINTILGKTT